MEQIGYVTEVQGDRVLVRVDRESACGGNCVSCKGCPTDAIIVECKHTEPLERGDRVRLLMQNKSFFKNMFLGYGLSVIVMILGAVLGYIMFKAELASVLGAVVGLLFSLLAVKLIYPKDKIEILATKDR